MGLETGLATEFEITVQEKDTARYNSGETLPAVFSTPNMIRLLEQTAHRTILPCLQTGQSSVGYLVNIRHLAATPIGFKVRARAEVTQVNGRLVSFKVEAWDEMEKIAEGEHQRYIIDMGRFSEKVEAKQARSQST